MFTEFNDRTLLKTIDDNQKKFNIYVPPKSNDPEEDWRWPGVRPTTRNKVMSIAAHLTSHLIFPNVFAQNDQDEEDKDAGNVMRDLVKWAIVNSDYATSFLFGIIAALVNPITYFHIEYAEIYQTIKERTEDGNIKKRQILDDEFSGIRVNITPPDEILLANAYEFELQRQRFIIKRRLIDYDEAKALYGTHSNFSYVNPGVKILYGGNQMFYEQYDEENPTLVEEAIYYNRREDIEVPFINGVYVGDVNVNANLIKHRDNQNRPKYPFVDIGYEPIDEKRFKFFKALVNKMENDQDLLDMIWRLLIDATHLAVNPPLGFIGEDKIAPGIMMPGSATPLSADSDVKNLAPASDLVAGLRIATETERSITESSQSPRRAGQEQTGQQTFGEIKTLEANARIQLALFGRMIVRAVTKLGDLLMDLIIHHLTVGEIEEILGGQERLKFRKFVLSDEIDEGKKITKRIELKEEFIGKTYTDEDIDKMQKDLFEKEGGLDGSLRIYMVNPEIFSKLKFKTTIEPDVFLPRNEAFEKAIKLRAWDRMIMSPFGDRRAIDRDFLFEVVAEGESDKYMIDNIQNLPIQPMAGKPTGKPLEEQVIEKEAGMAAPTGAPAA